MGLGDTREIGGAVFARNCIVMDDGHSANRIGGSVN